MCPAPPVVCKPLLSRLCLRLLHPPTPPGCALTISRAEPRAAVPCPRVRRTGSHTCCSTARRGRGKHRECATRGLPGRQWANVRQRTHTHTHTHISAHCARALACGDAVPDPARALWRGAAERSACARTSFAFSRRASARGTCAHQQRPSYTQGARARVRAAAPCSSSAVHPL